MASENYTARELMVRTAASEIEDGDVVFVGMRLPLIAFQVAVSTHAPNAMAVYESGVVRDDPADRFIHTMCDLPNQNRAVSTTGLLDIMSKLQRGDVSLGFLGGAAVDKFGNLNTTNVRDGDRAIRLPGSGGACDIACLAERTVLVMPHEPRRFVEEVDYVTSPGHRQRGQSKSPPGSGPSTLVTSKAIFGFDSRGELYLQSVHPGEDGDDVLADFPWSVQTATEVTGEKVTTTPEPTARELDLVRRFDPDGFWTGSSDP